MLDFEIALIQVKARPGDIPPKLKIDPGRKSKSETGFFVSVSQLSVPNASCFLELFSVGGAGVTPARLLALSTSRAHQIIPVTPQAAYGRS